MEIPAHIELRTEWYYDTTRGKQIHPDQLEGYIARHKYDSFGTPTKPAKVKKVKAKKVAKPKPVEVAPIKKPAKRKAKPAAKKSTKPTKAKTVLSFKRPAKRVSEPAFDVNKINNQIAQIKFNEINESSFDGNNTKRSIIEEVGHYEQKLLTVNHLIKQKISKAGRIRDVTEEWYAKRENNQSEK